MCTGLNSDVITMLDIEPPWAFQCYCNCFMAAALPDAFVVGPEEPKPINVLGFSPVCSQGLGSQ